MSNKNVPNFPEQLTKAFNDFSLVFTEFQKAVGQFQQNAMNAVKPVSNEPDPVPGVEENGVVVSCTKGSIRVEICESMGSASEGGSVHHLKAGEEADLILTDEQYIQIDPWDN